MTSRANELAALDRSSWLHPFTAVAADAIPGARVIVRGEGVWVEDAEGRRYLDAMAGLWCVNVGYGRDEIATAIARQARRLPFFHGFAGMANEPAILLARRLLEKIPGRPARVFFGTSGSDANETAIKLVRYYQNLRGLPRKKKILARRRAYHGVTLGASSVTGLPYVHERFDLPLDGFLHVTPPHFYREGRSGESETDFVDRLACELDETLQREGPDTVAAFFAEPVMGAGGVIVPPAGYFAAIAPVLRRHDVLLVADEVICGFGRLGKWFGSERLGLEPDVVTCAKGLTSGYVPMSACAFSEKIVDVLVERAETTGPLFHGYTYSGHPVAAAAALANLDLLEGEGLVERAAETGELLQSTLRSKVAGHPLVGELRGIGMLAGIELVADRARRTPFDPSRAVGAHVAARLADEGVLVRALGDTIAMSPPLTFGAEHVEELADALLRVLDSTAAGSPSESGREAALR